MGESEHIKPVPGISVVIPAFGTPGSIEALCDKVAKHVGPLAESIEVILVDDGSEDDTWQRIAHAAASRSWVRGLRLSRNYGQHNALLAGMREATLPIVVTMDDDLQNPPEAVGALLAALTDDVDLVYGSPVKETQSAGRNVASVATKRLMSRLLGPDINPRMSAFRLFRRDLLASSEGADDPYVSIDVILSWATTKVAVVDVEFAKRASGASGYNLSRLIRHALNMVTGYSTRPLRWVSMTGLVIGAFGLALLVYVVIRFLIEPSAVEGFTFLAAAISLFSGVQLLSLGVVGEYLSRMHFRTMGRPPYSIRSRTEQAEA